MRGGCEKENGLVTVGQPKLETNVTEAEKPGSKGSEVKRPVTDRGNEVLSLVALRKRGVYIRRIGYWRDKQSYRLEQ